MAFGAGVVPYISDRMASREHPLYSYTPLRDNLFTWGHFGGFDSFNKDVLELDSVPGAVKPHHAYFLMPHLEGEHAHVQSVGRLLWHEGWQRNQANVTLQVFLPVEVLPQEARGVVEGQDNIEISGMPEIVETMQIWHGPKANLKRLAFVFSKEEVVQCAIDWFGIGNVFLCRFRYDEIPRNGGGVSPWAGHPCFFKGPSLFEKLADMHNAGLCYHSRVWKGITAIQDAVHRCLNVSSQGQRHRQTKKVVIGPDVWPYLKSVFEEIVTVLQYQTQTIRQVMYNGAKRKAVSIVTSTEMLRFETTQQLDAFADIFGASCVYGIRRRRPRKGVVEHVKASEIFNIVEGTDDAPENRQRRRTVDDGVDLIFNGDVLTVVARYTKYVFNRNVTTGLADECPSNLVANIINQSRVVRNGNAFQSDSDDEEAVVGSTFEDTDRGIVVCVVEINLPSVRCAIVRPRARSGDFVTYSSVDEVRQMINDYHN